MGKIVFALEHECLGAMLVVEPGLVSELHRDADAGQLLRTGENVNETFSPIDEPGRELKQHDAEFSALAQRVDDGAKSRPEFVRQFDREIAVVDVALADRGQRFADVPGKHLHGRLVSGEDAECLHVQGE